MNSKSAGAELFLRAISIINARYRYASEILNDMKRATDGWFSKSDDVSDSFSYFIYFCTYTCPMKIKKTVVERIINSEMVPIARTVNTF